MTCCAGPIVADCSSERLTASQHALLDDAKANARHLSDGSISYLFSLPAIHCGNCITTLERELPKLPGVVNARANLSQRRVLITMDHDARPLMPLLNRLEALGFPAQSMAQEQDAKSDPEFKQLVRSLAIAGFASANIMLLSVSVWTGAEGATKDLFHFVSALIAVPAVAFGGIPFFRSALAALRRRRTNMDVPISLGVLLATGMSLYESFLGGGHAYFDAAVSLLFFLLIGRTLDHMMRARARAEADRLARLAAKGGFVVAADGSTTYLPLSALQPGMVIRVPAGERFPVDGEIIDGMSDVDRAIVTGESDPVRVAQGHTVESGTLNLTGSLDMRATRAANESFLAEVSRMMAAAEKGRGNYERIADRLARIYAPVVHALALTSFLGWMLWTGGDWHTSLTVAVAVLIITCPCALGLAVPVAHVIAAGRLFKAGILMKDGSALERLSSITNVVFDKTGTLTTGEPTVTASDVMAAEARSIAHALALRSIHPASRAIAAYFKGSAIAALENIREVPGHGVEATFKGKAVRLGRKAWVAEIASASDVAAHSGVGFAIQGQLPCTFTLSESLRAGIRPMVEEFSKAHLGLELLSGDAPAHVEAIAHAAGIENWKADLKPGDKLARLAELKEQGSRPLMVGDGLNDAPALAAAHVSMAPSSASDIGRNAADFVFTRPDLSSVSFAWRAATATSRIVRENFLLAIIYNIFAVPLAMTGQLNPLIAAIAMSTSSIIVVGNSLRLQRLRNDAEAHAPQAPQMPAHHEAIGAAA